MHATTHLSDTQNDMKLVLLFLFALPLLPAQTPTSRDRLVRQIRHELVMLPFYSVFDWMTYSVDGYNVKLMGQVTRPTLKSDAGNIIKQLEGVERVDNEIEVLPLSPQDDRIRLAVFRSIYSFPALNRYALQAVPPIHIIVKNGNVTLKGVVATNAEKNIANIRANTVSGVFSVTNDLMAEEPPKPPKKK
jgi:hyperosmotically inducible periplasmic protein